MINRTFMTFAVVALVAFVTQAANAALVSQYGILDLNANGGINPNTGVAWQAGDQYRLAFHTDAQIDAQSDDPAVYDAFATAQAQQNAALASSTGWTAMVWVNTDSSLPQALDLNNPQAGESPISSPLVRSGTDDFTGGSGQGGAGVPVYALDGMTAIARNNNDIYDSWSNPFEDAPGVVNAAGTGNNVRRIDTGDINTSPHYSPFLDQFGSGDTGVVHGQDTWTGGFGGPVNPLGNSVDPDTQVRASWGSSNANRTGRVWNRFQRDVTGMRSVYAISELLTISGGCSPGDTDGDGDIDTGDLTTSIQNFTGAGGSTTKTCEEGDTDEDGDVDTGDLTFSIQNFTGAQAGNAGVPDLVYDPATGNVTIDADGADVISFSLQSGPFNAADFSELPAGLTDNIASQIGWTSFNLFSGLTGTADLGAILPAGLDQAGLEAALTTASYGLALAGGGGGGRLDLIIPEPASMVLMGLGAVALVRRRRAA